MLYQAMYFFVKYFLEIYISANLCSTDTAAVFITCQSIRAIIGKDWTLRNRNINTLKSILQMRTLLYDIFE